MKRCKNTDKHIKLKNRMQQESVHHILKTTIVLLINYDDLNKEISKHLELSGDEIERIIFKKIDTPYNIISTVTRRIAWDSGKNTMVLNTGFFKDMDQVYVRGKKNAGPLIKRGKELGFKCGGKKEVLGAIVPKDKTDSYVEEILDFLSK